MGKNWNIFLFVRFIITSEYSSNWLLLYALHISITKCVLLRFFPLPRLISVPHPPLPHTHMKIVHPGLIRKIPKILSSIFFPKFFIIFAMMQLFCCSIESYIHLYKYCCTIAIYFVYLTHKNVGSLISFHIIHNPSAIGYILYYKHSDSFAQVFDIEYMQIELDDAMYKAYVNIYIGYIVCILFAYPHPDINLLW